MRNDTQFHTTLPLGARPAQTDDEVGRAREGPKAPKDGGRAARAASGSRGAPPRVAAIGTGTAIEWDTDDGRLISDCGRYEIVEDPTYGFASLRVDDDLEAEHVSLSTLKRLAQEHKDRG